MKLYHGNGIRVSAALVAVGMLLTASGRIGAADKVQGSAGSAVSAPPAKSSPDVWMDKWPDKMSSGAKIESSDGKYIVRGTSMKNSYGVVYRKFTVDIDKSPYISIDVTAVKGYWYLIAKNEKIKQGYVKVQADTNMTGKLIYDLRTVAGLTGTHEIELDMGVSSLEQGSEFGQVRHVQRVPPGDPDEVACSGALRLGPWMEKWINGEDTGAKVKENNGTITVTGASKNKSYAPVYRVVTVNLDKTPILNVKPASVTGVWYLEAIGGLLKAPVKIQPDTNTTERKSYELKKMLGLSGEQSFERHVGIGSGDANPNMGKETAIAELAFTSAQ